MSQNTGTEQCDHSDSWFVILDTEGSHYECSCGHEWVDRSTQIEDVDDEDDEKGSGSNYYADDDFDDDDDFEEEIDQRNI